MADEFEWRTDVEEDWEPRAPEAGRPARRPGRRGTLIILGMAACLLLVAGYGVYRSLCGQVEEATSAAEEGLLLAHELLVNGALNNDQDLVMSVVAQRPASWRDLMADLASRQLVFSRRPLGLEVVRASADQPLTDDDVTLAPELDAAEIADRRHYQVAGWGQGETVMLERTFFYQRVGGQWQLTPPADESAYWGNWVTDERANITTTYPERDEAVALKLSRYLDTLLPALCAAEGMACPDDFHLTLKLDRDPTSIRRLAEGVYAIRASSAASGDRLVLPAPSLVGRPLDEAGYQALQRGYAGWIGASIAAGYAMNPDDLDDLLAQFDLRPPPAPAWPLPRTAAPSFPEGTSRPDQDVLLLCYEDNSERLLRFETASGVWREESTGDLWPQDSGLANGRPTGPRSFLGRLPDYRGVIIQTTSGEGEQTLWQTYFVLDGRALQLTEATQIHYYLPPRIQPAGQPPGDRLVYFVPASAEGEGFSALMVRLEQCSESPCKLESLPGMPIWSPDGRRTVVITSGTDGKQLLYLGDEDGQIVAEIGPGQSPAWLDDSRFVYVPLTQQDEQDRLGRWLGQEALLVDSDGPEVAGSLYFDGEMVRQAIPASMRPDSLTLWTVQEVGPDSDWWYVTARGERAGAGEDFVVVYNPAAEEAGLVLPLGEYLLVEAPMVNSTGQQAVVIGLSMDGSQISVELIDAGSGQVRRLEPLVPQDWSADGEWLIQLDQGVMTLVSTVEDARWLIRHDLTGCDWAVWTQQED